MTHDPQARDRAAKRAARESYYVLRNCSTTACALAELERLFLSGDAYAHMADTIPVRATSGQYAISDGPEDIVPTRRTTKS